MWTPDTLRARRACWCRNGKVVFREKLGE